MDHNTPLLTDDEIVAITLDKNSFWPGILPTIQIDDPAAMLAAGLRGQRSLLVRELVSDGGNLEPGLEAAVAPILGCDRSITTYIGDETFSRAAIEFGSTNAPAPSGWVMDDANVTGIHNFTRVDAEEFQAFLTELLATAVSSDVPLLNPDSESGEQTRELWVCVAKANPEGASVVAARQGQVRTGRLDVEGAALESVTVQGSAATTTQLINDLLA